MQSQTVEKNFSTTECLKMVNEFALLEKAETVPGAAKDGLALQIIATGNVKYYILYDAKRLYQHIKTKYEEAKKINIVDLKDVSDYILMFTKNLSSQIIGMVFIQHNENQYGGAEIKRSAAKKGYGPLLMDIVMSSEGALVPDRTYVSKEAQNVYKFYKDSRKDVISKPLDDENDPKTPQKYDDTKRLYPGGSSNPINYAYFPTQKLSLEMLTNNHSTFVNKLDKLLGEETAGTVYVRIFNASDSFFDVKFSGRIR